jgi:predicted permease
MNLKLAVRGLRKNPFVSAAAIISLALGIGANAAVFSIFHQVLFQSLPVPEPARLVNLSSPGPQEGHMHSGDMGERSFVFTYPMFRDLEREQNVFTGIAAHVSFGANLAYRDETEGVRCLFVSGSYFPVLNLQPALGRLFNASDDAVVDEPHAVVLAYDYWLSRFAGDPRVLNQTLTLNGQSMTIIGVAPKGFRGTTAGSDRQVFVPVTMIRFGRHNFRDFQDRKNYLFYLLPRLRTGVTVEQATAAINVPYHHIVNDVEASLQQHMSEQEFASFKAKRIQLDSGSSGQSQLSTDAKTPLLLLFAVTGFVVIIACANIANLLLARGAARSGEMAVRVSIGASRKQLIAQLLTESCLLAAMGGLASIVVAQGTLGLLASLIPPDQAMLRYELDPAVMWFIAVLTIGTGILFGLFPALQNTRHNLFSNLKGQAAQASGTRPAARFRTTLATAQTAMAMALVVLAGLFAKSLFNIGRASLGLNVNHVVTFRVSPGLNGYPPERTLQFLERVEDAVSGLPGVTDVGASTVRLLAGDDKGKTVKVEGFSAGPDVDSNSRYTLIGPGYFHALGIPLISGREFTRSDGPSAPKVAIVNEQFAKQFHLGREAVGKWIAPENGDLDTQIVGLVQNSKYSEVKEEVGPVFFRPYRQGDDLDGVSFYVRTTADPGRLLGQIPPSVARIDPSVPVQEARTLSQQVQQNISPDRMIGILCTVFAVIATILAAVGLYGVLAYVVARRTKEIGLRMALGAAPAKIHAMVLRQVAWMALIGGILGLAVAVGAGRFAESILFKLNGHDPAVLVLAAVFLTLTALAAGFIPARRASRVDPIKALRYE